MGVLRLSHTTGNLHKTTLKISRVCVTCPSISYIPTRVQRHTCKIGGMLRVPSIQEAHSNIVNHVSNSVKSLPCHTKELSLKIGIIGMGAFGQFLAKAFQRHGHYVLGTSRSDYSEYCKQNEMQFFRNVNSLCEAQPDILLICSSILSTEDIVRGIPFHKLQPDTVIVDVLSVKLYPKNLLLEVVPSGFGILCTHPMFGKVSGKTSWEGLRFVYDKVRITEKSIQEYKCQKFLDIFEDEGCKMIKMSCEEHDKYAAERQFLTHTISRILSNMNLETTPIFAEGYQTLMELTQNTVSHGSDIYDGLFLYNVNAAKQLDKLEIAFDTVKRNIFGKLRDSFNKQMEETEKPLETIQTSRFLPGSVEVLTDISSFSMIPEKDQLDPSFELQKKLLHTAQY